LDEKESEELLPLIEESIKEYEEKGGTPWNEIRKDWEEELAKREKNLVVAEGTNDVYSSHRSKRRA